MPIGQENMAPSFVPLLPSGIVVDPSQNTATRLPSRSVPVIEPVRRDSHVPIDESSVAPGPMQILPRELSRNQGELVRSSLESSNPTAVRRRIVGKRTVISPEPLALSVDVDSRSVPDNCPKAGMPEAQEPSESDTKKRRVESNDESVDWFQRERSDVRELFEIDVGDPLESEKASCRDSSVRLSKRLSDGKSTEVTYHRLLPRQQVQFDEAMTQELS